MKRERALQSEFERLGATREVIESLGEARALRVDSFAIEAKNLLAKATHGAGPAERHRLIGIAARVEKSLPGLAAQALAWSVADLFEQVPELEGFRYELDVGAPEESTTWLRMDGAWKNALESPKGSEAMEALWGIFACCLESLDWGAGESFSRPAAPTDAGAVLEQAPKARHKLSPSQAAAWERLWLAPHAHPAPASARPRL